MHNLEIRWIELWVRHSKDYTGHFLYSDEFADDGDRRWQSNSLTS